MQFIGNYRDWIKDEWISELLVVNGQRIPQDSITVYKDDGVTPDTTTNGSDYIYQEIFDVYGWNYTAFHLIQPVHVNFTFEPPWIDFLSWNVQWSVMKLFPGQHLPMHKHNPKDKSSHSNKRKFLMFLTDYDPGHVFVYGDGNLLHYKKGDVFEFEGYKAHGAANISLVPRLTMQIRAFKID